MFRGESTTRHFTRLAAGLAAVLSLTGLTGVGLVLTASPASAGVCNGTAVDAGTSCTVTGTLDLTGGTLSLTSPTSLSWAATITGQNLSSVDTNAGDQGYVVNDATGSGDGWSVTASATTFTSGSNTLPAGSFVTNGSLSSATASTYPTATCAADQTCTQPTNSVSSYPVTIGTSPTSIYQAAVSTGMGDFTIGGSSAANPVGWWINIPSNAIAGTYTSTITLEVVSGP
jgi:WxL domain surface cell wall-binding